MEPDAKRLTQIPRPQQVKLTNNIGKYVVQNAEEVTRLGWTEFVRQQQGCGYFSSLSEVEYPERHLLQKYKHRGAPFVMMTRGWTEEESLVALKRGPHKSTTEHATFLREELAPMVEKGRWTVLPYSVSKRLPGLRLSLPGVKLERDRRTCWLGDYSYFKTNAETLPVNCLSLMQYNCALDRLLHEIFFVDPALGPVYILEGGRVGRFLPYWDTPVRRTQARPNLPKRHR